jgi:predicted transcriptional regulator of viral defense system
MARTYISENLNAVQQEFIHLIDEYEVSIFSINTIEDSLQHTFDNLNEILENLVQKKFLTRLERGKYCRSTFKNDMVIGCFLTTDGSVAYWTALNLHGLTEQFSNTIFIQTSKQKEQKNLAGTTYHFVKVKPAKIAGIEKQGYGSNAFSMTDIEKTIIDCFDLPQYSGGYAELIRAFAVATLDAQKMIDYCKLVGSIAVTKRLACLADILEKQKLSTFLRYAKSVVNEVYTLFDPYGSDEGEFIKEWRIRLNISREQILDLIKKQY